MDLKLMILSSLRFELTKLAKTDVKKGKLDVAKVYDLKPNAERLIKAWRSNPLTGKTLSSLKVTDEELTQMMKEVLIEVGIKKIKE